MTYSLDFRKKVLEVRAKEKLTIREAASRFGIAFSTIVLWNKNINCQTKRNRPASKLDREALKKDVELYPDAYQYERAKRFGVSKGCIWHAMKSLNITYKKKSSSSESGLRKKIYILQEN